MSKTLRGRNSRVEKKLAERSANRFAVATESAKELADENGIELSGVRGTGVDGKIVKADVQRVLNGG